MALFEFSIHSTRNIERQIMKDSKRLRKLEGEISALIKIINKAIKEGKGDVKEIYNAVQKLIQDYGQEIAYLIEITRDEEVLVPRTIKGMGKLDQMMEELQKIPDLKEISNLRKRLQDVQNQLGAILRGERKAAKKLKRDKGIFLSFKSNKGIEKHIIKESIKSKRIESDIEISTSRLNNLATEAKKGENIEKVARKIYGAVTNLIEDYKELINHIAEILKDDEKIVHRTMESMHELDQNMLKLEKEGYPQQVAEKLRQELSKEENILAAELRKETRYARRQYKEAA